jgi:hypothetical protein
MDKKAQGLSLNTIIVAIVVLIVLVVLIMIFTGYFGTRFTPEVTSCANSGGVCQFAKDDGSNGCGYAAFGSELAKVSGTCPGEQICCSKGLGTGTAPNRDAPDCGTQGKAPCSIGDKCKGSLELMEGTCEVRCALPNTCEKDDVCKTTASTGKCSTGVCCAEK